MEELTMQTEMKPQEAERRPYAPPRLEVHGTAAKLTANLDAGATDGKGGSHLDP
jgi:hypothetical protein